MSSAHDPVETPETVIEPGGGWKPFDLRELWRYRELLGILVWRDLKVRYKQTLLGVAWALLQPALTMLIFTAVFSGLANDQAHYPLFAYTGVLPWIFFATAITSAANSVVGAESLLSKVYFPRLIYPFAGVGAALVDFALGCILLVPLLAWYGVAPTWNLALVPLLVVLLTLAALGIGSLLAALNVLYRDVRYALPFLIQLWMFATPTIYLDEAESLFFLNPLTGLINAFRAALLGTPLPWPEIGYAAAVVLTLFLAGGLFFRRLEDSFAERI